MAGVDGPARRDGAADGALGAVRARHLPDAARVSLGRRHAAGGRDGGGAGFATPTPGRPFVRVLDAPPELTHAVGTNYALIHAVESADGREIQVMVAIDNLIKGAGGQAMQAMNLALGLEETRRARVRLEASTHADDARRPEPRCFPVYAQIPVRPGRGATAPGWSTTTASEWLDAYGGHAVAATGHSHPDVVRAIAEQAAKLHLLLHRGAAPDARAAGRAARARSVPTPLERVFFCNSGAEANENALASGPEAHRPRRRSCRCAADGTAAPSATLA